MSGLYCFGNTLLKGKARKKTLSLYYLLTYSSMNNPFTEKISAVWERDVCTCVSSALGNVRAAECKLTFHPKPREKSADKFSAAVVYSSGLMNTLAFSWRDWRSELCALLSWVLRPLWPLPRLPRLISIVSCDDTGRYEYLFFSNQGIRDNKYSCSKERIRRQKGIGNRKSQVFRDVKSQKECSLD